MTMGGTGTQYRCEMRRPIGLESDSTVGQSWNVREFENVIQRSVILASGRTLRLANLRATLREEAHANFEDAAPSGSFERQLRDYKVRLAAAAIRENNGNKTVGARSLSISRAHLLITEALIHSRASKR